MTHPTYVLHETGTFHPETPKRLVHLLDHLKREGGPSWLDYVEPSRPPDLERWVGEIHERDYLEKLKRSVPRTGLSGLDADTPISPKSLEAAELGVSGALTAVDRVMGGENENAFCAVRPPGHHAEAGFAMGFCLYNNVAVAARYLQKKHGLKRVFIIDWDVHHGNGTQHSFYDDPDVFFLSTHRFPFYPGTGAEGERGRGPGEGATRNIPFGPGAADADFLRSFEKILAPAMEAFRPDFVLLSAGFDAHREDPLGQLDVSDRGFAEMTRLVKNLAKSLCAGRIVGVLEGGYNLEALSRSVTGHLKVLAGV